MDGLTPWQKVLAYSARSSFSLQKGPFKKAHNNFQAIEQVVLYIPPVGIHIASKKMDYDYFNANIHLFSFGIVNNYSDNQ